MGIYDLYWGGGVGREPTGRQRLSPRMVEQKKREIAATLEKNKKIPFFGKDFGTELLRTLGIAEPRGVTTPQVSVWDVLKKVPKATGIVGKELLKIPPKLGASLYGMPKALTTGKAEEKPLELPFLGEIPTYYKDVERKIQAGADPTTAAFQSGFEAMLDTAIVAGVGQGIYSKYFKPKPKTITTGGRVSPNTGMTVSEARVNLGVGESATTAEIQKAYHKLAHQYHPDVTNGSSRAMAQINKSYQTLTKVRPITISTAEVAKQKPAAIIPKAPVAPKVAQPVIPGVAAKAIPKPVIPTAPKVAPAIAKEAQTIVKQPDVIEKFLEKFKTEKNLEIGAPTPKDVQRSIKITPEKFIKELVRRSDDFKKNPTLVYKNGVFTNPKLPGMKVNKEAVGFGKDFTLSDKTELKFNTKTGEITARVDGKTTELESVVSKNLSQAGFTTPEAIRFITQPSRWIHALDDLYFKAIGKPLEKLIYGEKGGQPVPPDPYSARIIPRKVRKQVQYGAEMPEEYLKLTEAKEAEHAILSNRADMIFKKANKLTDKEITQIRKIMESGEHPEGALGQFTKAMENLFYDLGEGLVQVGGLKPEQFAKYARAYYPKLYRAFESSKGEMFGRVKDRLNNQYTYSRKDISPEYEKALGIIDDKHSKYPLVKRAMQEINDVVLGRFFLATSQSPALASPTPREGFVQLPKNKKLGALSEMYVNENIAKDLESMTYIPEAADKFIQSTVTAWKLFKVPLNIPTVGRNVISNVKLADLLGGVPPEDISTWMRAIVEVKTKGPNYQELLKMGKISGFEWLPSELNDLMSSFKAAKNWQRVGLDGLKKGVSYYSKLEEIGKVAVYINNKGRLGNQAAGSLAEYSIGNYQKVPEIIKQLRTGSPKGKLGALGTIAASPFISFRYLFLPRIIASAATRRPFTFLKYELGKLTVGAMAISYVADKLDIDKEKVEEMFERAKKYWGLKGKMVMPLPGVSEITLPDGSKETQLDVLDLTFIEPYGDIPEFWRRMENNEYVTATTSAFGLFGNPWITIPMQISQNKDFYSSREIHQELDSPATKFKKTMGFIYKQVVPGTVSYVLPDLIKRLMGKPTAYGEQTSITSQLLSTFGVRTLPFNMSKYAEEIDKRINNLDKELRSELYMVILNKYMSDDKKQKTLYEKIEQYDKKLIELLELIK